MFSKGKNWTPTVTTPNAPKLTAKKNDGTGMSNQMEIHKQYNL